MMKRTILLLFAALCGVLTAAAQDLIVKIDATKIEAKVIEITPDAVRYKRFSNPDGPTYVLPVKEIHYIQYANGEKEYYTRTIPATPLTPATPATPTEPAPAATPAAEPVQQTPGGRYVLKQYEIGELYDRDGVRGVICQLSDDGLHGAGGVARRDLPPLERVPQARPAGGRRRQPDRRSGEHGDGGAVHRRQQPFVG